MSHLAPQFDVAKIVGAFEQEQEQFHELKADMHEQLARTKRLHNQGKCDSVTWQEFSDNMSCIIDDIDRQLTYLDNQLMVLRKGERVFTTNDPEQLKTFIKDYLEADVSISLKNMALIRYDYKTLLQSLDGLTKY